MQQATALTSPDTSLQDKSLSPMRSLMPERLVVVRHGESEANVINRAIKHGELNEYPAEFSSTPDREIRLSSRGLHQAELTGAWLRGRYPDGFDAIYVSDHTRAKETAGTLCLAAGWEHIGIRVDPLVGERNWGTFASCAPEHRAQVMKYRERDPLHNPMPDGETLLETRHRSRELLDRCARHFSGQRVLVITHGEYIEALWAEISHMNTERQKEFFSSPAGNIKNCQIVEFASVHPESGESTRGFQWSRSSCPHAEIEGSWDTIERVSFTAKELLAQASCYPRLEWLRSREG